MKLSAESLLDKLCATTAYSEKPSQHHHDIIEKVWSEIVRPAMEFYQKDKPSLNILDIGSGDGHALQIFEANGHFATGLNRVEADRLACCEKKLACVLGDMHKLPEGWAESFDLVWARHIFEHSPFPMRALCEAHYVLRPGGLLYVEVPAPDTACHHELNPNHFSIMPVSSWAALISRAGFEVLTQSELRFRAIAGEDAYFCFMCRKAL